MKKCNLVLLPIVFFLLSLIPNNAFAADFYFTNAEDGEWSNVNNWFSDSVHTIPAGSLPGAGDDAYINGNVTAAGTVEVANMYIGTISVDGSVQSGNYTVSGDVYVGYSGSGNVSTFIGGVTSISAGTFSFYESSYILVAAVITSSAGSSFYDSSYVAEEGVINGDVFFYDNSFATAEAVYPTINGSAYFYDSSQCISANITDGAYVYSQNISIFSSTCSASTRYHYFYIDSSSLISTEDYVINGYPWTIVADAVEVDISDAVIDVDPYSGVTTVLSTINGGSFIYGGIPSVDNYSIENITQTSADISAVLVDNAGLVVSQSGFVYGLTNNYGATTTTGVLYGPQIFSDTLTGLTAGTQYHYAAFATNGAGTVYSADQTFTTLDYSAPTVTTSLATSLRSTSAVLNGSVSNTGGSTITERGFIYGTTTNYGATTTQTGLYGTGDFSISLSGLDPSTVIHYKAYAKNNIGTSYGSDQTLTTFPVGAPVLNILSSVNTGNSPFSITVLSTTTVVTSGYTCDCLTVHDVSNKSTPVTVATRSTSQDPGFIVSKNDYVYVSTYLGKLETWDLTDPSDPIKLGTYSFPTGYSPGKMKVDGDRLYIAFSKTGSPGGGVRIFSIADPATTTVISTLHLNPSGTTGGGDMLPVGNYLYVADYFGYTLRVYDISDIQNPVLIQNITGITEPLDYHTFEPWRLATKGDALYLFDDNIWQIYDISSSTNMVYETTIITLKDTEGVEIRGNLLYFAGSGVGGLDQKRVQIYDISDPFDPFVVADLYTGLNNYWMDFDDDGYLYMTSNSENKLHVFDAINEPEVTLESPTGITSTGATLNADIIANNNASTTQRGFNYGLTTSYGFTVNSVGLSSSESLSEDISGLTCNTTYHYQAFATNYVGTATSSDSTFTTSDCPGPEPEPTPTPSSSGTRSGSSASSRVRSLVAQGNVELAQQVANQYNIVIDGNNVIPQSNLGTGLFTRNLTVNYRGPDVRTLQQFLNSKGFTIALSGPGSPGNETSFFGPLTRSALARFQSANGISPAIGFFGPITRAFIQNLKF